MESISIESIAWCVGVACVLGGASAYLWESWFPKPKTVDLRSITHQRTELRLARGHRFSRPLTARDGGGPR